MSKKILKNVKDLKYLSILIKNEHMDSFNEIINLYETRKIKQLDTAKNLIVKLASSRGTGKKSTINKISKISKGINNIKKVNPFMRPIKPKSKKFHITANIDSTIEYISSMKKAWKNKVTHKYQSMSKQLKLKMLKWLRKNI